MATPVSNGQALVPIKPQSWPGSPPLTLADWPQGVVVLQLTTPKTQDRREARLQVRAAIAHWLAPSLGCAPEEVPLLSQPGQPLRLAPMSGQQALNIGIAVSHEPGLSLVALHRGGPVGIDLLALDAAPAWAEDISHLTQDYLGPTVATAIATLPLGEQAASFAQYWTQQEARLKCLGRGLEEWSPALAQAIAGIDTTPLHLPSGYVGSLALPR
ncbi:MAG TPA: 4'-phosphopantetheinyl transferase superfamily protein [Rhodocyclaceae bacterium]|nr:4'-phosphopantetheinyl transferase superfamily protein [Rhodocyclaceae bacterium]